MHGGNHFKVKGISLGIENNPFILIFNEKLKYT